MDLKRLAPVALLALLGVMALCVAALLLTDGGRSSRREAAAMDFQRLVGGLGFGPAADFSRCAHSFDPRVLDGCVFHGGPLSDPGSCPSDAGSVLSTRSRVRDARSSTTNDHAHVP